MKLTRFLGVLFVLFPCVSGAFGASDFQSASQLLSAARRGDIQTVQILINRGVDVNYTDATGLSLVCTAVMNNDARAIQVLQMYGADASKCDRQIKNYKQKTRVAARGEEYGFFSGLSSSHILALSALGIAGVIGGVALLTDVFDSGSENSNPPSGGSHSGSGSGGSGGSSTSYTTLLEQNLPYGPKCSDSTCPTNFSFWEENNNDFTYMSDTSKQNTFNYLMVARAYNAFVRGYLGMGTVRISSDKSPFDLSSLPYVEIQGEKNPIGGEKPVNVAMITASGVNATGSAVDGLIPWIDSSKISIVQSACAENTTSDACQKALANATKIAHKYYNYTGADAGQTENTAFDLTGGGTVFGSATDADTKLAKIIGGWEYGGRTKGDFYGFIPNGQLLVYKTGTNHSWTTPPSGTSVTGEYSMAGSSFAVNDTLKMFGGTNLTIASVNGNNFTAIAATDGKVYNGYVQGDELYIDSNANGVINQIYNMGADNELTLTQIIPDYENYAAIYNAVQLMNSGDYVANVVANLALPDTSVNLGYATLGTAKIINDTASNEAQQQSAYKQLINRYYNLDTTNDGDVNTPGVTADLAFNSLGNNQKQILVNSAGHTKLGFADNQSINPQEATFENFAPVVYSELENLFATVVAVKPNNTNGTSGMTIESYNTSGAGEFELAVWNDPSDSSIKYSSRMCGLAGTGNGGAMNPWCFAAPGTTDMEAAAAMAGSIALVKSAFDYMTPKQIFLLLALTADGPYLGSAAITEAGYDSALAMLKAKYVLPGNLDSSDSQYLESFKNAFGYGMINLERATRPGTNVYFYSSDKNTIVATNGNAFWGSVSTNTSRSSTALSLSGRNASVKTAFFDVVESLDGSMSLPRVWNMEFALNNDSKSSLYMGDVLADFAVDSTNKHSRTIGDITFDMAMSPRAYIDNFNGLDNLKVAFSNEKYDLDAGYQRHLTDGQSRFDGRANGVLSLVSNGMSSGAAYKYGNFKIGARAFSGVMSDENLLENDPALSSQYEPMRLGLANGGAMNAAYVGEKFDLNISVGNMHENRTVLGALNDGFFAMNGADTQYVDAVMNYKPFEKVNLFARATFANTDAKLGNGMISEISNIKSNSFAIGSDIYGFNFTAAMPLAVVDGRAGYDYADLSVVEQNGKYTVAVNNPHTEYIDLSAQKRELRFSGSYKQSLGEFTDAGVGFIYRVNPGNTDAFGNESIFMLKIHHRLGI